MQGTPPAFAGPPFQGSHCSNDTLVLASFRRFSTGTFLSNHTLRVPVSSEMLWHRVPCLGTPTGLRTASIVRKSRLDFASLCCYSSQSGWRSSDLWLHFSECARRNVSVVIQEFFRSETLQHHVIDIPPISMKRFASSFLMRTLEWNTLSTSMFHEKYNFRQIPIYVRQSHHHSTWCVILNKYIFDRIGILLGFEIQ